MKTPLALDDRRSEDDRRQQGIEADNTMPWQVKAVGFIGVPSVIALFLVYTLVNAQTSDGKNLREILTAHVTAAAAHADESKATGERLERYLQLICVNTAKTDQEKSSCIVR